MKLAIAFGGGGARALASLGVMSVLAKEGIRPCFVAGTSMGAVIAAYYGSHGETETLKEWYLSKKPHDYFSYIGVVSPAKALIGTQNLKPLLTEFAQEKRFEETVVPVRIVATNLRTGKEIIFRKGLLVDAMMASTALPSIMPPYKIDGEYYVDGGLSDATPVDLLPKSCHQLAIDYANAPKKRLEDPGILETMMLSYEAVRFRQLRKRSDSKRYTLIRPVNEPETQMLRCDDAPKYIRMGEKAGKRLIAKWRRQGILEQLQND